MEGYKVVLTRVLGTVVSVYTSIGMETGQFPTSAANLLLRRSVDFS